MAKDPAVLFYYQDSLVGTEFMTNEETGIYIKMLCYQADKGKLTKKQVLSICKASAIPEFVQEKFLVDSDGLYYNQRMLEEKEKRSKFAESRRNNALGGKASAKHMEDEDVNINKDNNKDSIQSLWIKTFGRNPSIPEQDETQKLIDKFGYEKTYDIMYQANLDGFKKIKTLVEALDDKGNIKPKESSWKKTEGTGRVVADYAETQKMLKTLRGE